MGNKQTAPELMASLGIPTTKNATTRFRNSVLEYLETEAAAKEDLPLLSERKILEHAGIILNRDAFISKYWPLLDDIKRHENKAVLAELITTWVKPRRTAKHKDAEYRPSQSTQSTDISSYYPPSKPTENNLQEIAASKPSTTAGAQSVRVALRESAAEAMQQGQSSRHVEQEQASASMAVDIPYNDENDDDNDDELEDVSELISPKRRAPATPAVTLAVEALQSPTASKGKSAVRNPPSEPPTSYRRPDRIILDAGANPVGILAGPSGRKRRRDDVSDNEYDSGEQLPSPSTKRAQQRSFTFANEEHEHQRSFSTVHIERIPINLTTGTTPNPVAISTRSNTPYSVRRSTSNRNPSISGLQVQPNEPDNSVSFAEELLAYFQSCRETTLREAHSSSVSRSRMETLNHEAALLNHVCSDVESRLNALMVKLENPDAVSVVTSYTKFR